MLGLAGKALPWRGGVWPRLMVEAFPLIVCEGRLPKSFHRWLTRGHGFQGALNTRQTFKLTACVDTATIGSAQRAALVQVGLHVGGSPARRFEWSCRWYRNFAHGRSTSNQKGRLHGHVAASAKVHRRIHVQTLGSSRFRSGKSNRTTCGNTPTRPLHL